jgi:DNA-binding protein HU-alpha
MRKPELAAAIAEQTGLTKDKANDVITAFTDQVAKALSQDDTVSLIGFGTFSRRSRAERKGKNPQTGAELIIPASNTAAFKPGKGLKDKVQ